MGVSIRTEPWFERSNLHGVLLRNPQFHQRRVEARRRLCYAGCREDRRTRRRQENKALPSAGRAECGKNYGGAEQGTAHAVLIAVLSVARAHGISHLRARAFAASRR